MKVRYLIYILLAASLNAFSQEVWTLKQCLETGQKNSLDFQLGQLDIASAEAEARSPLMELLPKVDLVFSHNYSIGSTIDPATNSRVSSNIQTDNFALNANLNLLDLNVFTAARRNRLAVLKASADKEATAVEYSLSVLEHFYNALYTQELLTIQLSQFENAKFNLGRIEKEAALGSRPKSDLYDMQVSYALEENAIVETRQLLYNRKLALIQFMNVHGISPEAIVLDKTHQEETGLSSNTAEADKAIENYPAVQSAVFAEAIARKEVNLQRNRFLPVLSAYYSYSSFYYLPLNQPGSQSVNPFWTQLNDNKNHYIGLQLNVPVFNGFRTHRDRQMAKIAHQKRKVEAEQERIKLRQFMERESANLHQNIELARKLQDTRNFAERSFTASQSKFSNGLIEAIVFTTAKNQLLTAEYNLLKALYTREYLYLKLKVLSSGPVF